MEVVQLLLSNFWPKNQALRRLNVDLRYRSAESTCCWPTSSAIFSKCGLEEGSLCSRRSLLSPSYTRESIRLIKFPNSQKTPQLRHTLLNCRLLGRTYVMVDCFLVKSYLYTQLSSPVTTLEKKDIRSIRLEPICAVSNAYLILLFCENTRHHGW